MTIELEIDFDREKDGRWIAGAVDLPGTLAYGATREEARAQAGSPVRQVIKEQEASN